MGPAKSTGPSHSPDFNEPGRSRKSSRLPCVVPFTKEVGLPQGRHPVFGGLNAGADIVETETIKERRHGGFHSRRTGLAIVPRKTSGSRPSRKSLSLFRLIICFPVGLYGCPPCAPLNRCGHEFLQVKGRAIAQHEVNGTGQFSRQNAVGLELSMLDLQAFGKFLEHRMAAFGNDGRLTKSPAQIRVAEFSTTEPFDSSSTVNLMAFLN